MANFEVDIQAMPMGMHAVVSEGGTNLLGGQRQLLEFQLSPRLRKLIEILRLDFIRLKAVASKPISSWF
jgi:hypothetical protein